MIESVLIDSNVFIRIHRGDTDLRETLEGLPHAVINTVVYFELLCGEPSKRRFEGMQKRLDSCELVHLNETICEKAIDLVRKFEYSKGMDYPDALIAATCIEKGFVLYTLNRRHFNFIPDLKVI